MNAAELRARRILFARRAVRRLTRLRVEWWAPPARCRNCGKPPETDNGFCSPLCNAEHVGMA